MKKSSTSFTTESKDFSSTKEESKKEEEEAFMRKRSVSSSSSMLNGFYNTLDRISRDHGGAMVSEEEKRVNRGKMNLISKIVTPILCLMLCYFLFVCKSTIINVLSFVGIAMSTLWLPITAGLERRVNYVVGFLLFVNWAVFWMTPIVVQGAVFKLGLHEKVCRIIESLNRTPRHTQTPQQQVLKPIYDLLDTSKTVRKFASTYIYKKEKYADFFATQAYFVLGAIISLGAMMYYHKTHDGVLPFHIIMMYNFAWIGPGGRSMGAAYSIAHKEGHFDIYRKSVKRVIGNFFENGLGIFYGSVPYVVCYHTRKREKKPTELTPEQHNRYNFTSTHISIHHRLDAGRGDTLYNWDISRSSVPSFLLYLVRGLLHTSGLGGLWQFYFSPRKRDRTVCFQRLLFGIVTYVWCSPGAY